MAMYKEFRNIEVPPFLLTDGWQDCSYSNDACPRSERKLDLKQEADYPLIRVWVEEDDPALRDEPDNPKFAIQLVASESDDQDGSALPLYRGEDYIKAQTAIFRARESLHDVKVQEKSGEELVAIHAAFMARLKFKFPNYATFGNNTLYCLETATKYRTIVIKVDAPSTDLRPIDYYATVSIITKRGAIDSRMFSANSYAYSGAGNIFYVKDASSHKTVNGSDEAVDKYGWSRGEIDTLVEEMSGDIFSYVQFWRNAYAELTGQES